MSLSNEQPCDLCPQIVKLCRQSIVCRGGAYDGILVFVDDASFEDTGKILYVPTI